jgi:hypothetical protein
MGAAESKTRVTITGCGKAMGQNVANLQQLVWTIGGSNAQLLQQLQHEPAEAPEGAGKPDMWAHPNQHILRRMNI